MLLNAYMLIMHICCLPVESLYFPWSIWKAKEEVLPPFLPSEILSQNERTSILHDSGGNDEEKNFTEAIASLLLEHLGREKTVQPSPFLGTHEKRFAQDTPDSDEIMVSGQLSTNGNNPNNQPYWLPLSGGCFLHSLAREIFHPYLLMFTFLRYCGEKDTMRVLSYKDSSK